MFSLRRADRERLGKSSAKRDRLVLSLVESPRRLLATLLIGNESVNVAISAVLAGFIERFFHSGTEFGNALLATAIALPLLLLIGEIAPKTIAIGSAMQWARKSAGPLWLFGVLVSPLRWVVRGVADGVLALLGSKKEVDRTEISEEEFKVLVDVGSAEGEVDDRERRLIHKVFEFGDKTVAEAMRKRSRVFALSYELPLVRLMKEISSRGYSRVPIYDRDIDNIRGILYAKDLLIASCEKNRTQKLSDLLHEPYFVPQTKPIADLFAIFKEGKTHMALVVDEYGILVGIVTLEDLLEELFGEIRDEREMQQSMPHGSRKSTGPLGLPTKGELR